MCLVASIFVLRQRASWSSSCWAVEGPLPQVLVEVSAGLVEVSGTLSGEILELELVSVRLSAWRAFCRSEALVVSQGQSPGWQ